MNVRALFCPVQGGKPFYADVPCTVELLVCGHTWRRVPPRVLVSTCGCPCDAAQRAGPYRLVQILGRGEEKPVPVYSELIDVGSN